MSDIPNKDQSSKSANKSLSLSELTHADFGLAEEDPHWEAAWEAYTSGEEAGEPRNLGELRAVVQLPMGRVELAGAFDEEVLAVFADLITLDPTPDDLREEQFSAVRDEIPTAPRLTLLPETPRSAEWRIQRDDRGIVASGSGVEELQTTLWEQLLALSVELNPAAIHLSVPCLELNGHGLVLAGGTDAQRSELTDALLRCGASYVTRDDLVVQEGTRCVFGTPSPYRFKSNTGLRHWQAASSQATVVPRTSVGLILVLTHEDAGAELALSTLSFSRTTIEIMALVAGSGSGTGTLPATALEVVAHLVAGASCLSARPPQTESERDDLVQQLQDAHPPDRRRLAVMYRLPRQDSVQPKPGEPLQADALMVRFDQDAVLLESKREQEGADTPEPALALLSALQADELLGYFMQAEARGRSAIWPAPNAFGLTDCPTGAPAKELWKEFSFSETKSINDMPTGVAVELLSRDLLTAPHETRDKVLHRHVVAQRHASEVAGALIWVLRLATEVQVKPVVVGSLLQVWDGRLPEHFIDLNKIDLLVRRDDIDKLLERLTADGFQAVPKKLGKTAIDQMPEFRLHHAAIPDIAIDFHFTLASGPFEALVDPEEFHNRAIAFAVREQWVFGLHPEHRFITACVEACAGRSAGGSIAQLREVVMTAPSSEELLIAAVECSSRLGVTAKVFSAVRQADELLPGLPRWLVGRARQDAGLPTERATGFRARLSGRNR